MTFVPAVTPPSLVEKRVWFVSHPNGLVVREEPSGVSLPRDGELALSGEYLGLLGDAHAFAAGFDGEPPAPFSVRSLRSLFGALDEETFAVAGRATQIALWAATHRFCGGCGTPTRRLPAERAMRCDACNLDFYPRLTPAIIVLVRRGEEALLARGSRFPMPFYSTLAGFVEPGESLEETLAREVREEVGLEVRDLRYFGSQPWPFPHALMVGFFAEHAGGEIRVDGQEILDAKWFRAGELPLVPPKPSIARRLIDAWVAEAT